jgi:zinc transport system permease protein
VDNDWLSQAVNYVTSVELFHGTFLGAPLMVYALLAVVLLSLICGSVGPLVVGNRMAFFSDALAHCSLAGVGFGFLVNYLIGGDKESAFYHHGVPLVAVAFGILVGCAIAYVRERTALASDTVIGVFFAGALGLGAVLLKALARSSAFPGSDLENIIFGDIVTVDSPHLYWLLGLAVVTAAFLAWRYNQLVFTSFNASLARSRRMTVRLNNYLFIILLALIVNLSLQIVGVLLINALLIVPAATAANVCRNMRQMFWVTVGLCLTSGVVGLWLSWDLPHLTKAWFGWKFDTGGSGGSIVVVSVLLFFASMVLGSRQVQRWWQGLRPAGA